jgi:hypothetical protein
VCAYSGGAQFATRRIATQRQSLARHSIRPYSLDPVCVGPSIADFQLLKPISAGGFGKVRSFARLFAFCNLVRLQVFLGRKVATGDLYAIKVRCCGSMRFILTFAFVRSLCFR